MASRSPKQNPRYTAWVQRTGGGANYRYIQWINEQRTTFAKASGRINTPLNPARFTEGEEAAFTKFLQDIACPRMPDEPPSKLKGFLAGLGIPEDLKRQILEIYEREVKLALLKQSGALK